MSDPFPSFPLANTSVDAKPPFKKISGIYPHLAAWNHREKVDDGDGGRWFQNPECGIGAVVPWAGKLWFLTYTSHCLYEGNDKLFSVDADMRVSIHPESAGGTHACRMIHGPSRQLFIGCYAIAEDGTVRVIDRKKLPGRLTAVATHLTDPLRKIYYYTQECSLYEVDVETLEPKLLFVKPLPGWHAKGAYTAQGRLVVAHNGEEPAPSPHWQVTYTDTSATVTEVEAHLKTPITYGAEDMGVLGEWDGKDWRVISRRQHNDVMGPGGHGLSGNVPTQEPIWAQGWDRKSVLLHVLDDGEWRRYRLPKGSYTYDGYNGSYTEWPRFREVDKGRWLMCMHGTFFNWPANFRHGQTGGIRPVCTYQRYIPDFGMWGEDLVLAGQDASRIGVPWAAPGHPHSNLQFIKPGDLEHWGPRRGYGAVWRDEDVVAGGASDPFLVSGYESACLHLSHSLDAPVVFAMEADRQGKGEWEEISRITVPSSGYLDHAFKPETSGLHWVRLRCLRNAKVTAMFHLDSVRSARLGEGEIFLGLSDRAQPETGAPAVLHVSIHNHNLCVMAPGKEGDRYFEVDERIRFLEGPGSPHLEELRREATIRPRIFEDGASFIAVSADGRRLRLPKSPGGSRHHPWGPARDVREVIQERSLANIGGTFYEIPRFGVMEPGELRNLPDYSRMRPIASHPYFIHDFTVWRGLLVLSGVTKGAPANGHIHGPGDLGLWFGAMDDLWKMGPPVGVGGPWLDSPVAGGMPSDPFLMTGFHEKTLTLSHRSHRERSFRLEVDFTADGMFHPWRTLVVPKGETLEFRFPNGFQAHWFRLVPDGDTVATAQVVYR